MKVYPNKPPRLVGNLLVNLGGFAIQFYLRVILMFLVGKKTFINSYKTQLLPAILQYLKVEYFPTVFP